MNFFQNPVLFIRPARRLAAAERRRALSARLRALVASAGHAITVVSGRIRTFIPQVPVHVRVVGVVLVGCAEEVAVPAAPTSFLEFRSSFGQVAMQWPKSQPSQRQPGWPEGSEWGPPHLRRKGLGRDLTLEISRRMQRKRDLVGCMMLWGLLGP